MSNDKTNPNYSSRKELFMILETLKSYAKNARKAIYQKDILNYIEKDFDYKIRRDRIPSLINEYNLLSEDPHFSLRYKIVCLKKNRRTSFYIKIKDALKDKDISNISEAICNNLSMEPERINELNDSFLNFVNDKLLFDYDQRAFIQFTRDDAKSQGYDLSYLSDDDI